MKINIPEIRRYFADEAAHDDSMLFIAERDHDRAIQDQADIIEHLETEVKILRDLVRIAETVLTFGDHFGELERFKSASRVLSQFNAANAAMEEA